MQCGKGRTGPHSPRGVPAGYIAPRLLRQAAGKGTPHPSPFWFNVYYNTEWAGTPVATATTAEAVGRTDARTDAPRLTDPRE